MNSEGLIDPVFLPFTVGELTEHMPPQGAVSEDRPDRWVNHFVESARRYREFLESYPDRRGVSVSAARLASQIEKDERFWTASAFMTLIRGPEPIKNLVGLLANVYGKEVPVDGFDWWDDLVAGRLYLYLEPRLPSPRGFQDALAERIDQHPVAYVRMAARRKGQDELRRTLEGPTNVDAMIVNPDTGFGLLVEAKALSDVSYDVSFDPVRNQIARNLDVMLEPSSVQPEPLSQRDPDRSFFLLVTPQLFIDNPTSRLYGWLMNDYRNNHAALERDLVHRPGELDGVSDRIGWISWETINSIAPGACGWLEGGD